MRRAAVGLVGVVTTAALALPAPAAAATDVLPDLAMARIDSFRIQTSSSGQVRLRFPTVFGNVGQGPFRLRLSRPNTRSQFAVAQRIYNDSGGYRTVSTPATGVYGGDGHDHVHVMRMQRFELTRASDGVKVEGKKTGFCFFDNTRFLPNAPPPLDTHCGGRRSTRVTMNLSVGWGDEYAANLPNQYVVLNGLPSGDYRLRVIADPSNWFAEVDDTNNETWTDLTINMQAKTVQIRGFGPGYVLP